MAANGNRLGVELGVELPNSDNACSAVIPALATPAKRNERAVRGWSVLLVGPLPPPAGGMANQTAQLAAMLAKEGCRVTVVRVNEPYHPTWVSRIRGIRALFRLVPYLFRLARATRSADIMHVMANSGWAWHLWAAPAIWIGRMRGRPVVVNYRGGDADAFFSRQIFLVRPTLASASRIIVPSGFLAAVFAKHRLMSSIVPNIVDLDAFKPARSTPSAPHLIVTRNLEPIYDIGTAIRAFAIVVSVQPDARLTIAGAGPSLGELKALARRLGIAGRVRFTGQLNNERLPALYRTATILVNPSRIDNMPISLLEAMSAGVPIVTTDVGGIQHIVKHEKSALLVRAGDHAAMAEAVLRVIGDPCLAERLRAAAHEAVQRYGWSSVRGALFDVYTAAAECPC